MCECFEAYWDVIKIIQISELSLFLLIHYKEEMINKQEKVPVFYRPLTSVISEVSLLYIWASVGMRIQPVSSNYAIQRLSNFWGFSNSDFSIIVSQNILFPTRLSYKNVFIKLSEKFFNFSPCCMACRILVLWSRTEPRDPCSRRTISKFLRSCFSIIPILPLITHWTLAVIRMV